MIKVYKWNIYDKYEKYKKDGDDRTTFKLTYNKNTNTIDFDIIVLFKQHFRQFQYTLDVESSKESVFDLVVFDSVDTAIIGKYECFDYISRLSGYSRIGLNGGDSLKFARVVIDDNGDVFITLSTYFNIVTCEGATVEIMDMGTHSSRYYLMRDCEWLVDRVEYLDKKKSLISNTDIYRNVSYLEAQVDLLTKLVLALTEGKADDETQQLLKIANEYSVLNIKPTTAIEEEFTENKANFRKIQEQYYESLK